MLVYIYKTKLSYDSQVAAYIDYNVSMPAQTTWRLELLNPDQTDGFWHAIESQVRDLEPQILQYSQK